MLTLLLVSPMHRVNACAPRRLALPSCNQSCHAWNAISSLMPEPDDETGLGYLLVTALDMDPAALQGYRTRVSSPGSYINLNSDCLHLAMPHPANPKFNVGSCHVNRCPSTTTTNPSPPHHPHYQQHKPPPSPLNPKPYNPKPL